jgi:ribonuclease HII
MIYPTEQMRLQGLLQYENEARLKGFQTIAGIDEAGRGPLAGPVVAAACIIPQGILLPGVNDSKQLSPAARQKLFQQIKTIPDIIFSIGRVDPAEIDRINIYQATIVAMQHAVGGLSCRPDYLLVDGMKLPHDIPVLKIIKGDALSQSIAAASIIAKVTRDAMMEEYDKQWPQYGFAKHKGYGTAAHLAALAEHGPCPIHRRSFAPISAWDQV